VLTHPPVQCVPCLFPLVKRQGRGVDRSPPSNVKVKERVELYIYSSSGPSYPVLGRAFALPPICACVYMTALREKFAQLCAFHRLSTNVE